MLIGAAGLIAAQAKRPLSETASAAIVACVVIGAIVALVPLVAYYERQKNETLDDRQRALEALARTVASSAEQISIAAGGLHEIAELAQKNLRQAEQLPHRLQEKIAEFQAQLSNANEDEREELEKELAELRAGETERLESTATKISKTAAEFAKLEAATQQHLQSANEALSKVAFATANAIGKAQAAAEQALGQARQEAARSLGETAGTAVTSIEAAKNAALSDIGAQFETHTARLKEALQELTAVAERISAATPARGFSAEPDLGAAPPPSVSASTTENDPASPPTSPRNNDAGHADASEAPTPKRVRKPKRDEATATPAPTVVEPPVEPSHAVIVPPAAAEEPKPSTETAADDPVPASMHEVTPVAPPTAVPFEAATPPVEAKDPTPPARRRTSRKQEDDQPGLGLDLGEADNGAGHVIEQVLSSDGATRLLVTAYIGIGNRLFIRGSGPGLNWDKGTPLNFVSIGKWRWETNDASGPVEFKLLKNDEQECPGLGTQVLAPGHQQELTANF